MRWSHRKGDGNGDIVGFEIVGIIDGYKYEWMK